MLGTHSFVRGASTSFFDPSIFSPDSFMVLPTPSMQKCDPASVKYDRSLDKLLEKPGKTLVMWYGTRSFGVLGGSQMVPFVEHREKYAKSKQKNLDVVSEFGSCPLVVQCAFSGGRTCLGVLSRSDWGFRSAGRVPTCRHSGHLGGRGTGALGCDTLPADRDPGARGGPDLAEEAGSGCREPRGPPALCW